MALHASNVQTKLHHSVSSRLEGNYKVIPGCLPKWYQCRNGTYKTNLRVKEALSRDQSIV